VIGTFFKKKIQLADPLGSVPSLLAGGLFGTSAPALNSSVEAAL